MFFQLTPPAMIPRAIAPAATLPGKQLEMTDGDVKFVLFVPDAWKAREHGTLTIHFHGATWYAIQEHLRHAATGPVIAFSNGEGSIVYRKPFLDRMRFRRWIRVVENRLNTRIDRVDLSSFSAGYGAIREILRVPTNIPLIHRIVLADSMYAGYEPIFAGAQSMRPAHGDFDVWLPFCRLAAEGKKEFVFTHSMVPTSYAASYVCARWLCLLIGVRPKAMSVAVNEAYPLRTLAEMGNFHVWGYGGTDAGAHIVHARHLADVWNLLDGPPR